MTSVNNYTIQANCNINVDGGHIISDFSGGSTINMAYQSSNSTLNITGGIIEQRGTSGVVGIDARAGSPTINISGGKLSAVNGTGVRCVISETYRIGSSPIINMTGGEITCKESGVSGHYKEDLYSEPTINMSGGVIKSTERKRNTCQERYNIYIWRS